MALLYVEEHEKSLDSEFANGTIYEGDLVTREVGGGVHPTDATSDSSVDGIVVHLRYGDNIAEHEYDFSSGLDDPYEGDGTAGSDRPSFAVPEQSAIWRPKTIDDSGMPAPSIERNITVGVPEITDVADYTNGPVIVEEGYTYTNDSSTDVTISESNDNFIPLGEAELDHGYTETGYGERVRVRLE